MPYSINTDNASNIAAAAATTTTTTTTPVAAVSDHYLPQDLSLPDYVPLKRSLHREFLNIFSSNIATDPIKPALKQHQEVTNNYLQHILSNEALEFDIDSLRNYLNGYKNLFYAFSRQERFSKLTQEPEMVAVTERDEGDVDLNSLDEFHMMQGKSFVDQIKQHVERANEVTNTTGSDRLLRKDKFYQLLKNIIFVIENPEEPIPDDIEHFRVHENDIGNDDAGDIDSDGDNDELNVSGGKISLKDPMTMNFFVKPKKSTRCGHTYEESSILELFRSGQKNCPISGCKQQVDLECLEDDVLMLIRVRTALRSDKTAKKDLDLVA